MMLQNIVAVFLIFLFLILIGLLVWACVWINRVGLLGTFFRTHFLLSILSGIFVILFFTSGIAVLLDVHWGVTLLRQTIYGWLIYLWLYSASEVFRLSTLLRQKDATRLSHFVGRSKFFDQLVEKTIAYSKAPDRAFSSENTEVHAVTDSPMEALLEDEELFKELFPLAIRRKIRRKTISLAFWTLLFGLMLLGLG